MIVTWLDHNVQKESVEDSSIVPGVNGDLHTTCRTLSMLILGIGIGLVAAGKDISLGECSCSASNTKRYLSVTDRCMIDAIEM